jgi:hypothetical protein
MGVSYSPKIVTDGLVLALDAANVKSFRGEPTENLIINNPIPTSTSSYGVEGGAGSLTYDDTNNAIRWIRTSYASWGAYFFNNSLANYIFDTSSQYTITFEWKFGPSHTADTNYTFQIIIGNAQYVVYGGTSLLGSSVLQSNGWYKFTQTHIPSNDGVGQTIQYRIIGGNKNTNVTDIFWRKLQYEKKPYATPFVNGTRGTTVATGGGWADLSSNTNHGELVNGPTFDSANLGSISFDGVDDYVNLPTNLLIHDTGNPFTFSFWFKTTSTGTILGQQNTNTPGTATGFVPAIYVGTNGILYTSCFWGGSTSNQSTSPSSVNSGNWNNITVTFLSNNQVSYLNGVSYATLSKTQTSYSTTYYYFIGAGFGGSWINFPASHYFNGNISNTLYYNRALSASEVLQNYNATKGRFGL